MFSTPLLRVLRALYAMYALSALSALSAMAAFGVLRVTAAGAVGILVGRSPVSVLLRADAPTACGARTGGTRFVGRLE
ncbi:MAG: hypothetical protein H7306_03980 [Bacteriovorax sp.]|nr:hypothetical protein [Rhizobacter sp.]